MTNYCKITTDLYTDGQKLSMLHVDNANKWFVGESAESIEIVMEPGMYADIPHALVTRTDGKQFKYCMHSVIGAALEVGE